MPSFNKEVQGNDFGFFKEEIGGGRHRVGGNHFWHQISCRFSGLEKAATLAPANQCWDRRSLCHHQNRHYLHVMTYSQNMHMKRDLITSSRYVCTVLVGKQTGSREKEKSAFPICWFLGQLDFHLYFLCVTIISNIFLLNSQHWNRKTWYSEKKWCLKFFLSQHKAWAEIFCPNLTASLHECQTYFRAKTECPISDDWDISFLLFVAVEIIHT